MYTAQGGGGWGAFFLTTSTDKAGIVALDNVLRLYGHTSVSPPPGNPILRPLFVISGIVAFFKAGVSYRWNELSPPLLAVPMM